MITIQLEQDVVTVGDRISGHLTYPDTPIPQQVTIQLYWYTEGRGTRDTGTVQTITLTPKEFDPGYPIGFSLDVPSDGPVTYNGSLLRILWEVRAVMKYPGWRPRKEKTAEPFLVTCR